MGWSGQCCLLLPVLGCCRVDDACGALGAVRRGQPGFLWRILWHWSRLNKAPSCLFFPIIFLCLYSGREQIPSEREGSSSALLTGNPLANPTGFPAHGGTGILAATCSSAWGAQTCAGPSTQHWPFFLCLFLLSPLFSPCCHPISPLLPPPWQGFAGDLRLLPQFPPWKCRFLVGLCFPEIKRCWLLPWMAAGDQKLPKKKSKTLSFSVLRTPVTAQATAHGATLCQERMAVEIQVERSPADFCPFP